MDGEHPARGCEREHERREDQRVVEHAALEHDQHHRPDEQHTGARGGGEAGSPPVNQRPPRRQYSATRHASTVRPRGKLCTATTTAITTDAADRTSDVIAANRRFTTSPIREPATFATAVTRPLASRTVHAWSYRRNSPVAAVVAAVCESFVTPAA